MAAKPSFSSCFFSAQSPFKYVSLSICTLLVACSIFLSPAVSSPSDDATVPIHVIGSIRLEIPVDQNEEFEQITLELFTETEVQERPILYTCNRDIHDPSLFVWNEEWRSYNAFEKHLDSPHFKHWYSHVKKYQVGDLNVIYAPVSSFKKI